MNSSQAIREHEFSEHLNEFGSLLPISNFQNEKSMRLLFVCLIHSWAPTLTPFSFTVEKLINDDSPYVNNPVVGIQLPANVFYILLFKWGQVRNYLDKKNLSISIITSSINFRVYRSNNKSLFLLSFIHFPK